MNKTETLLYIERLREGIRKLPDDARIYGFEMNRSSDVPSCSPPTPRTSFPSTAQ